MVKVQHIHRFIYVQRPHGAVFLAAIVIVHAISDVGILLNFTKHRTGADGVRRACRDEDGVACGNRNAIQTVLDIAFVDGAAKNLAGYFRASVRQKLHCPV